MERVRERGSLRQNEREGESQRERCVREKESQRVRESGKEGEREREINVTL